MLPILVLTGGMYFRLLKSVPDQVYYMFRRFDPTFGLFLEHMQYIDICGETY
jgi:hypothetical protein